MTLNLLRIADSAHASKMADSHGTDDGNRLQEELSYSLLLSDRVRSSINESRSYKSECSAIGRQVDILSHILRSLIRLSSSLSASLYERPFAGSSLKCPPTSIAPSP
ncbi:hypothetical protein MLD38_008424 [Melastoma candidum]|uniref:Uncharacterized protein n=1 Tax=Melastoma candidum TaxID=119954 RepID=A0ACB9RXC1_9MYRT|nr:hypothetical protein MLD38_008424 [Melastoma candidum]